LVVSKFRGNVVNIVDIFKLLSNAAGLLDSDKQIKDLIVGDPPQCFRDAKGYKTERDGSAVLFGSPKRAKFELLTDVKLVRVGHK